MRVHVALGSSKALMGREESNVLSVRKMGAWVTAQGVLAHTLT